MTYIEFFEKTSIENMCACLASPPERVLLIGVDRELMRRFADRYIAVLKTRKAKTQFEIISLAGYDLASAVETINAVADKYPDAVFDVTGGDDIMLMALGTVISVRSDIKVHRFDIRRREVNDIDGDGLMQVNAFPRITVAENIALYGGRMLRDRAILPESDKEYTKDLQSLWRVCKQSPHLFNTTSAAVLRGKKHSSDTQRLAELLERNSLISRREDGKYIPKNDYVRQCLLKSGTVLEHIVYCAAKKCRMFDDVRTGAIIDWDGAYSNSRRGEVENEIDVLMTKGARPYFVSCKNGNIRMEELYKLNTVAERFGDRYSVKALFATDFDTETAYGRCFKMRAEDLGVRLYTDVCHMTKEALMSVLRSL